MKRCVWMLLAGAMTAGVFGQDGASGSSGVLLAKATDRRVDLHDQVPADTAKVPQEAPKKLKLPEGLEYGALFEVEVAHSDGETDATMATVELGAGWQMTDWLHGDVVFLYEEDATDPMELNQLYITLGNDERFPLILQVGKFYAPFGNLDSLFVSDPIVLELAEGLEEGASLGFEKDGFNASLTLFDSEIDGEDLNAIAAVSYGIENEESSVFFGASLIHNILDADGLTGVLEDAEYTSADEAAGFNAWLTATKGPITFIAETVQVLNSIEIDGTDTGLKPVSLNLELGYALTDIIEVGAKYEYSKDVADWFAEQRFGAVCNATLLENDLFSAGISLEYMRENFDGGEDADFVTMQLGLEF